MAHDGINRFQWERAVISKGGPVNPTTRHVLLTLATYAGRDLKAYPSTMTLAGATALSERAVCTHLEIATQEGWITRVLRGEGKGWRNYIYTLAMAPLPAEPRSAATHGTEPRSAATGNGTERRPLGAEPGAAMVLNDVPTNNVLNTSNIKSNGAAFSKGTAKTIEQRAALLGMMQNPGEAQVIFMARVASAEAKARGANA